MYKEYISYEDKLALRDVLARMPNAKPAAVVNAFIEITGSDQYFKRNLVMYVVNTKNASQKWRLYNKYYVIQENIFG